MSDSNKVVNFTCKIYFIFHEELQNDVRGVLRIFLFGIFKFLSPITNVHRGTSSVYYITKIHLQKLTVITT